MARKHPPTFAEIAAEARLGASDAARPRDARPGRFGRDGALYDPQGRRVELVESEISPDDAVARVRAGAVLAFESCGCGGAGGGACTIAWFDSAQLTRAAERGAPAFVRGYGAPTWIDVWEGDGQSVVFAHGDVRWGTLLG